MTKRGSGILLHITSLPSYYGIGDLGPAAYKFADFLTETGQKFWQIVPLNPTAIETGNNPYTSYSAFAGNALLISPEILVKDGLLTEKDLKPIPKFREEYCEYEKMTPYKEKLFNLAYDRFKSGHGDRARYGEFCKTHSHWLEDFALFVVITRRMNGKLWNEWPKGLKDRDAKALKAIRDDESNELEKEKFLQYLFFRQWFALKRYCNEKQIKIIGDIPIYVNYDSVDVWTHPKIFKLDKDNKPIVVSGVPPDYFSKTGQLWGNPVYNWDALKKTGYKWWIERMAHNLSLVDILRVDHFRGLVAYWEVPAGEKTAINGKWVKAPAVDFLNTLCKKFPALPILAEDLGIITPDVREVMEQFGFPGMRVLLFAFSEDNPKHPYLPDNYVENCVAYTGTHDNNTARAWFETEITDEERKRINRYIGHDVTADNIYWELIRIAMESIANTVVFPMQDILGLGGEARMNTPSKAVGNYRWRLLQGLLDKALKKKLLDITVSCRRAK